MPSRYYYSYSYIRLPFSYPFPIYWDPQISLDYRLWVVVVRVRLKRRGGLVRRNEPDLNPAHKSATIQILFHLLFIEFFGARLIHTASGDESPAISYLRARLDLPEPIQIDRFPPNPEFTGGF